MIKIICDRCGADIGMSGKLGYIAWNFKTGIDGDLMQDNTFEDSHFCTTCMNQIRAFIKTGSEENKPNPETAKETLIVPQENPEKTEMCEKAGRRRVDHGKIRALKNAGWSNKDIAEEMDMTPNAVANSLCTHKTM